MDAIAKSHIVLNLVFSCCFIANFIKIKSTIILFKGLVLCCLYFYYYLPILFVTDLHTKELQKNCIAVSFYTG